MCCHVTSCFCIYLNSYLCNKISSELRLTASTLNNTLLRASYYTSYPYNSFGMYPPLSIVITQIFTICHTVTVRVIRTHLSIKVHLSTSLMGMSYSGPLIHLLRTLQSYSGPSTSSVTILCHIPSSNTSSLNTIYKPLVKIPNTAKHSHYHLSLSCLSSADSSFHPYFLEIPADVCAKLSPVQKGHLHLD